MKRLLTHKITILILRLAIGGIFLAACLDKIANPDKFAIAISNYRFLPEFLVNFWAIVLPWIELLIGLALILGIFVDGAALVSGLLYLSFIIALSAAMVRGLDIDCGCFDTEGKGRINAWYLVRDFSLLAGSVWILLGYQGKLALESLWKRNFD